MVDDRRRVAGERLLSATTIDVGKFSVARDSTTTAPQMLASTSRPQNAQSYTILRCLRRPQYTGLLDSYAQVQVLVRAATREPDMAHATAGCTNICTNEKIFERSLHDGTGNTRTPPAHIAGTQRHCRCNRLFPHDPRLERGFQQART